jgi:hypothetical protein
MKGGESGKVNELMSEWICEFVSRKVRVNKSEKIHYGMNKGVFEWMDGWMAGWMDGREL